MALPKLKDGHPATPGNVVAAFSLDNKQYHLNHIMEWEKLEKEDLKRILLIDDDAKNLEHWLNQGCQISHNSCIKSATFAKSESVFSTLLKEIK